MYVKLFTIWFLAVVSFFALWAILAKVVKHITERNGKRNGEALNEVKRVKTENGESDL